MSCHPSLTQFGIAWTFWLSVPVWWSWRSYLGWLGGFTFFSQWLELAGLLKNTTSWWRFVIFPWYGFDLKVYVYVYVYVYRNICIYKYTSCLFGHRTLSGFCIKFGDDLPGKKCTIWDTQKCIRGNTQVFCIFEPTLQKLSPSLTRINKKVKMNISWIYTIAETVTSRTITSLVMGILTLKRSFVTIACILGAVGGRSKISPILKMRSFEIMAVVFSLSPGRNKAFGFHSYGWLLNP